MTNFVSPKKLLNSKWTAVKPTKMEKHFLITEVQFDENGAITHCLIEAVLTRRSYAISWQELRSTSEWISGWQ